MPRHHQKLLAITLVLFALILIPFVLWEDRINTWAESALRGPRPAAIIIALLASDVLLPIPSSIVSTASGYLLGFLPGAAACWLGMMIGSIVGYAFGRSATLPLVRRFVTAEEMARLEAAFSAKGDWILIASRPVPMLAEASVIMAGLLRRSFARFCLLTALANLGVSLVYAAVGALSLSANSFLLAFFGALLIPFLAMRLTPLR